MSEKFIPYELAVKLKEKGFNEPCFGWYYATPTCQFDHKENIVFNHSQLRGATYDDLLLPSQGDNINAPTISQVLKWLREEKEIYISVFVDDDSDNPVTYEIYKGTECVCSHQGEYFTLKEWQKCESRAIEYVLDNLI